MNCLLKPEYLHGCVEGGEVGEGWKGRGGGGGGGVKGEEWRSGGGGVGVEGGEIN